jgi:hypothetical protein
VRDSIYDSPIINTVVRCRQAVSFRTQPSQPRYSLHRRLGGPQSRFRRFEKKETFLPFPRIEPAFLDGPACSLVAKTEYAATRLLICGAESNNKVIETSDAISESKHADKELSPRVRPRHPTLTTVYSTSTT